MMCPTCLGTGKFPLGSVCKVCKGRAELPDTRADRPQCRFCIGTGKWGSPLDICPICNGWGRLPKERLASEVLFVQAGSYRTAQLQLEKLFNDLSGDLRICDPYYGRGSLHRLDSMKHCPSVRFLTKDPDFKERSFIDRAVVEFMKEHSHVEIRRYPKPELHDRFVLSPRSLLLLGHGLKDLGGKQSFVVHLHADLVEDTMDVVRADFDEKWAKAALIR